MNLINYTIIVAIGVLSAVGQYLLKIGAASIFVEGNSSFVPLVLRAVSNGALIVALVIYVTAFGLYLFLLARLDLSQAFPTAIAVNILLVAVMASVFLGESVTASRVAGMAMIATGIFFLAR